MMKTQSHYDRVWRMLRPVAHCLARMLFNYTCEQVDPGEKNYLVVVNHNTDLDPALVGLAFPRQMYFLASEHVFRKGFSTKLLRYLFNPVSRIKGATDAAAAMDIIRMLRKGHNLCLFAEGNRSFSGVTGPIFPATGKLAKASGAALVTYRLIGGYLSSPRWSKTLRRGKMRGECVHVYSPEQLKAMTVDEVNAAIVADLYEDAFARALAEPCDYNGKRLAEGLEDALFLCPSCGGIATLHGRGNEFLCDACGMRVVYGRDGFFTGIDGMAPPFTNVRDWDKWQLDTLRARIRQEGEALQFANDGIQLVTLLADHTEQTVANGRLTMNSRALTLGEMSFPLESITDMALVGPTRVVFSADNTHYEIHADLSRYCGRKYLLLFQLCKAEREAHTAGSSGGGTHPQNIEVSSTKERM